MQDQDDEEDIYSLGADTRFWHNGWVLHRWISNPLYIGENSTPFNDMMWTMAKLDLTDFKT